MDTTASRKIVEPTSDRRFFTGMALALALSVFAGFAPTYYLKGWYGARELSPLVHLHGLLFTSWILLFVTQTMLVATRRTVIHKRLGVLSALLAVAMVVAAMAVAVSLARRGQAPGLPPPLVFLAVTFSGIVLFATLFAAGFYTRRWRDTHKRLMLLATISISGAALDRLLFPTGVLAFSGVRLNAASSLGLLGIFVGACFVYDLTTRGRVHSAFLWGGLCLMATVYLSRAFIGTTSWWLALAGWLTS